MTDYHYFAFVSYKREDEKWAKWIQNSLEHYHLPSVLRREHQYLPKSIKPIFRDKTDLGAGVLQENLRAELEASKYLIVICSPNSRDSEWVGREIEVFSKSGRAAQIIPVIVDGRPNCGTSEECFHQAIRDIQPEILGINVQEIGKKQALVKVVARLLDLRYENLWQRESRRAKRNGLLIGCLAFVILLALTYAWDYNRIKVKRYQDCVEYADLWMPKGIGLLSKKESSARSEHYQFEYRRRKLRRVFKANSFDLPIDEILVMGHPLSKDITPTITRQDMWGRIQVIEYIGGEHYDRVDLKSPNRGGQAASLPKELTTVSTENTANKSEVHRYVLTKDENGYVIRKVFKKYNGDDRENAADGSGIYGFEFEYDSEGRLINQYYLGEDQLRICNKIGVACEHIEYDEQGNMILFEYRDEQGALTNGSQQLSYIVREFDSHGNEVNLKTYNTLKEVCMTPFGFAEQKSHFNKYGLKTKVEYFDTKGNRCVCNERFSSSEFVYDSKGREIRERLLDINDCPTVDLYGVSEYETIYDKNGHVIQKKYYGLDKNPCYYNGEYARIDLSCDAKGNVVYEAYFGASGERCVTRGNYSYRSTHYDEQNRITGVDYYGPDEVLCIGPEGYAKIRYVYDDQGNVTEVNYYGSDEEPCLGLEGFSSQRLEYDENGNTVRISFYGTDGRPCYHKNGYSQISNLYDAKGNLTQQRFLDPEGQLCMHNEAFSIVAFDYDTKGNVIAQSFFDVNGQPCIYKKEQYWMVRKTYDEKGNSVLDQYYGTDGQPCLDNEGCWSRANVYDDRGNLINVILFGIDGRRCMGVDHFSRSERVYDERGRCTEERYYGVNDEPCYNKNGYHRLIVEFDAADHITKYAFLNPEGNLSFNPSYGWAFSTTTFDMRGNLVKYYLYGADGNPVIGPNGWAGYENEYDPFDCQISTRYLGTDFHPVLANGVASVNRTFDYARRLLSESNFGIDNEPVSCKDGYHKSQYTYNAEGKIESLAFYDSSNGLCMSSYGYAKVILEYDEFGRTVAYHYFDDKGKEIGY